MYSFVGRRSTTAETTAAAAAHLGVTTEMFLSSYLYTLLFWGFCTTFPWKTKEKKARSVRAPHDNSFTGPTIYSGIYVSSCVFTGPTIRSSYSFLFFLYRSGVHLCLLAVFWYHKLLAPASDCLGFDLN